MDRITTDDLKRLAETRNGPCISIFMPASRIDPDENRIRYKNLFRQTENMMTELRDGIDVQEQMAPAGKLLDDRVFWQHQSDGLALFLEEGELFTYRLPVSFETLAVVSDRFHIKPLIQFVTSDSPFYLLALSQGKVQLFDCTIQSIEKAEQKGMPQSLQEALKYDDPERQLQFHTETQAWGGKRTAMFHGHGVGIDDSKDRISRFFQELDRWIRVYANMHDSRRPLVIAGVDYLLPIYRESNSYPHLIEGGIIGNPDELEERELHRKAWKLLEPHLKKDRDNASARYRDLAGTGRTSEDLKDIVPAAAYGRVDTLFVAKGVQQWGSFDPTGVNLEIHGTQRPGDDDLLDLAALLAFTKGGKVYVEERENIPADSEVAALFRF
ncbi:MAG: hypothetical protein M0P57_03210 [Syntrophales bacterium]|jgi:hypothetical protein|nr:hypothetical protein [Syntrophales bacterium]MDY0043675.1 hypothetical protein [Syntrophales bacterium]